MTDSVILAAAEPPGMPAGTRPPPAWLLAGAALRLGPRACLLLAWHRLRQGLGAVARALPDTTIPHGALLPGAAPDRDADGDAAPFAAAAEAAIARGWHGPFAGHTPAIGMDLFAPGDIRPVWEANRLLALPLLVQAARLAPADGHLARAEAVLRGWIAANPPYRGPAWACGQEAALRGMHLCLALALLDADRAPEPAMRALLAAHARRIGATRAYAAAQDNNHAISEPAGLFVIGLVLGDAALARRGARQLSRAVARLVAPDGAFAQASPGYHRLLLDTLWVAEWFRRRHGAEPFPAPFAARAAAATGWLDRVMEPSTGALPRCGAVDDSAFADLSLHGPADSRGSLGRALDLFGAGGVQPPQGRGDQEGALPLPEPYPAKGLRAFGNLDLASGRGGVSEAGSRVVPIATIDPGAAREGCAKPLCPAPKSRFPKALSLWWGGVRGGAKPLPDRDATLATPLWFSEGWAGARTRRFHLLLRTGAPLRFRPAQADLLHLDVALDGAPLLIDGGTGAYNPPPGWEWWTGALAGTLGHNTVCFDGEDQMPRAGRFLFARWPRCRALPDGAALRDARGRRHERRIAIGDGAVTIEDRLGGPFKAVALRWRLADDDWTFAGNGAASSRARLHLEADAPCRIRLVRGWHSPAYGRVEPATVLELAAAAPVGRLVTRVVAA